MTRVVLVLVYMGCDLVDRSRSVIVSAEDAIGSRISIDSGDDLEVRCALGIVKRIVLCERNDDDAVVPFFDEVESVIEELTEEGNKCISRSRKPLIWGRIGNEELRNACDIRANLHRANFFSGRSGCDGRRVAS